MSEAIRLELTAGRRRRRPTMPFQIGALLLLGGLALAAAVGLAVAAGFHQVAIGLTLALPLGAVVLRWPFAIVVLWALIMPFFLESLSSQAGPMMWALHRLALPGTLVLIAVYHALGIRRSPFRFGLVDVALIGFIALSIVNVLLTASNTQRELVSFYDKLAVPIALFWLVRATRPSRREIEVLVAVGVVTILFQVALGILSWVAPGVLPAQWLGRAGERTVGTFGGPAPYTITLVFYGLLVLHRGMLARAGIRRAMVVGLVALALLAVFLSLSRGSWLGAGLAFAGLVVIYPRIVVPLGLTGLVLVSALAFGPLSEQIGFAQERLEDDATVASRIITNDAAFRMIEERPLIGFGYGQFERYDEAHKQRSGDIPLKLGGSSHNTYLNLAAELGLPSLLLYFAAPVILLVQTVRMRRRLKLGGPALWGMAVILWLALLDQFVVSNFLEMVHAYVWGTSLWWLTLGLIAVTLDRAPADPRPSSVRASDAWSW